MIDYAIPAYYYFLPQYLKSELVRLEKRTFYIIVPGQDYEAAKKILKIGPLQNHLENLYERFS